MLQENVKVIYMGWALKSKFSIIYFSRAWAEWKDRVPQRKSIKIPFSINIQIKYCTCGYINSPKKHRNELIKLTNIHIRLSKASNDDKDDEVRFYHMFFAHKGKVKWRTGWFMTSHAVFSRALNITYIG